MIRLLVTLLGCEEREAAGAPLDLPGEAPADPTPVETADTGATPGAVDTGTPAAPCTGVRAIFFDLGETLVTWDEDRELFLTRPGTPEAIAGLKAAGVRVGIITNTGWDWDLQDLRDLRDEPGLLDAFEVVLMSSEATSPPKPSAEIFAEAATRLVDGPPIGQIAFVTEEIGDLADSADAPTEGARAAGMFGVWMSDRSSALADATIPPDALPALVDADWLCPSDPYER